MKPDGKNHLATDNLGGAKFGVPEVQTSAKAAFWNFAGLERSGVLTQGGRELSNGPRRSNRCCTSIWKQLRNPFPNNWSSTFYSEKDYSQVENTQNSCQSSRGVRHKGRAGQCAIDTRARSYTSEDTACNMWNEEAHLELKETMTEEAKETP